MKKKKRTRGAPGRAAKPIAWADLLKMQQYCIDNELWREVILLTIPGSTALRHSDFSTIKWEDIWAPQMTVIEKKTGKRRQITIGDKPFGLIRMAYSKMMGKIAPSQRPAFKKRLIFGHPVTGKPITRAGVKFVLERIADKCGVPTPISAHSLRKSWATRMYEVMGADHQAFMAVSSFLNHSSLNITMRYLGFDQENRDQFANKIWDENEISSHRAIRAPIG